MKITTILIFACFLSVSAKTLAQKITLKEKNANLSEVLNQIRRQSGYDVICRDELLGKSVPVTVTLDNASLDDALKASLRNQALTYEIEDGTIIIKEKEPNLIDRAKVFFEQVTVTGKVQDELGNPMVGVTVKIKDTQQATATDKNGVFNITVPNDNTVIVFSFIGYESKELRAKDISVGAVITLKATATNLHEVVVQKGYYQEKREYLTGDISTVTAKEIEQQPVANVLLALQGKVPGLVITQTGGLPGAGVTVQIRGQNSISNGSDPFYVIDGVPYNSKIPAGNGLNPLINTTAFQQGSPLNYINPDDIESVEVLKDADATAIYGSRAANGAILITTKKGKVGPMKVSLNASTGITKPARYIQTLNTQQYLAMRNEAFKNDGQLPGAADYDVNGTWDQSRYTNWGDVLLGNNAVYSDYQASVSGGTTNTQYLVSADFRRQTTGFPTFGISNGSGADKTPSAHFNINSTSPNQRFSMSFAGSYLADNNTVEAADLSRAAIVTAPDAPALFNPDGTLNWAPIAPGQQGTWNNPLASLYIQSKANTSNLVANGTLGYMVLPGLKVQYSFGYTNTQMDQETFQPVSIAGDPARHLTSASSTATFQTNNNNTWIIEPQINFERPLGPGSLSALVGTSFQSTATKIQNTAASGFTSDALIENPQAATSRSTSFNSSQYKYTAVYARLGYVLMDKYILNLTARRDGSTRFGPGKQFGNFGSIGTGWIFSKENFVKKHLSFLSFGKIRASYGITGNDQIGDYQFLDLYAPTPSAYSPYGGGAGLTVQNLFNPDLAWEIGRKLEAGIELGFLDDRIMLSASYYRNRISNQLVYSPVSLVTGFSIIAANFPAIIQNTGVELELHAVNVKAKDFSWSSSANLTIPRNELVDFPNIANSTYANLYVVGQPITLKKVYQYAGVNPTTGLYQFVDHSGVLTYNPSTNPTANMIATVDMAPKFYGGFQNTFNYKRISLDINFQFVKQTGKNYFGAFNGPLIGPANANVPSEFLTDYWQKPGDNALYQRLSQNFSGSAYTAASVAYQSNFAYSDASYIRLKNVALSWQLPDLWSKKLHLDNSRIFINAQNILTITKYNGIDPETQSIFSPPKKVFVAGFSLTL